MHRRVSVRAPDFGSVFPDFSAALNVYKKVAIIRGSEDVLTYEDGEGNFKTVTDLHLAAVATVSTVHVVS